MGGCAIPAHVQASPKVGGGQRSACGRWFSALTLLGAYFKAPDLGDSGQFCPGSTLHSGGAGVTDVDATALALLYCLPVCAESAL